MRRILKEKDKKRFLYTIEFFPEEGKYHADGHANCKISLTPEQSKKNNNLCPVCKKPLTIGVLNRVAALADRPEGFKPDTIGYKSLVPLAEIIAESYGVGKKSKKVQKTYFELIEKAGSEFGLLLDVADADLEKICGPEIALGIKNVSENNIRPIAGYDGIYGTIKVFKGSGNKKSQKSLF